MMIQLNNAGLKICIDPKILKHSTNSSFFRSFQIVWVNINPLAVCGLLNDPGSILTRWCQIIEWLINWIGFGRRPTWRNSGSISKYALRGRALNHEY